MNVVEPSPTQAPLTASEFKANQCRDSAVCSHTELCVCVCVVCWCFGGWGFTLPVSHLAFILYCRGLSCNWTRIWSELLFPHNNPKRHLSESQQTCCVFRVRSPHSRVLLPSLSPFITSTVSNKPARRAPSRFTYFWLHAGLKCQTLCTILRLNLIETFSRKEK